MMNTEQQTADRRRALEAMAAMPAARLAERYARLAEVAPASLPVRGPEIGAVMVRGRAGGGGAAFNLGEASVTRATVKLAGGEIGHAVVLGRDGEKARMVAHLDALRQLPEWVQRIDDEIVIPARQLQNDAECRLAEETEATRVNFFTLVRGED
ncbi:phosphonate C-P lyase system protein PhnG [Agaricicola taiwanensis]|nr:phosphonate C-P lyase system protein PhnG [Agaricicola taiwanensis]